MAILCQNYHFWFPRFSFPVTLNMFDGSSWTHMHIHKYIPSNVIWGDKHDRKLHLNPSVLHVSQKYVTLQMLHDSRHTTEHKQPSR